MFDFLLILVKYEENEKTKIKTKTSAICQVDCKKCEMNRGMPKIRLKKEGDLRERLTESEAGAGELIET